MEGKACEDGLPGIPLYIVILVDVLCCTYTVRGIWIVRYIHCYLRA